MAVRSEVKDFLLLIHKLVVKEIYSCLKNLEDRFFIYIHFLGFVVDWHSVEFEIYNNPFDNQNKVEFFKKKPVLVF